MQIVATKSLPMASLPWWTCWPLRLGQFGGQLAGARLFASRPGHRASCSATTKTASSATPRGTGASRMFPPWSFWSGCTVLAGRATRRPRISATTTRTLRKCFGSPVGITWPRNCFFLQCLAILPELLTGHFQRLPVGQVGPFYRCILQSEDPSSIALGKRASYYSALLKGTCSAELADGEAGEVTPPVAAIADDEEFAPIAGFGLSRPPPPTRTRKRGVKRQAPADISSLWPLPKRRPVHPAGDDAARPPELPAEEALIERAPSAPSPVPGGPLPLPAAPLVQPPLAEDIPIFLEGVRVVHQKSGPLEQPGSWRRYQVNCGFHAKCSTTRNIGPKTTMHYGDLEPLGFLGQWLASANRFEDSKSHRLYKPTSDEVGEYIRSRQLAT